MQRATFKYEYFIRAIKAHRWRPPRQDARRDLLAASSARG
jgi:hypothetical protein